MKRVFSIKAYFEGKMHIFLTLCCIFLLSACADEVEECGTVNGNRYNCLLCSFFKVLKESATNMANATWNEFAVDLSKVVLIAATIYIAFSVLKMVGAFGKQNVGDFLTSDKNGLMLFAFKTTVIWFLLAKGLKNILTYLIAPLLQSAIDISQILSPTAVLGSVDIKDTASWGGIFDKIYEVAEQFNNEIDVIVALGQTMACVSTVDTIFDWQFLLLIYGVLIFVFGWILMVGISFYLVDILVRLLFAAVLLPLGIACAVSKLSISYTKNIWNLFLNVFFSLIILGIVINITLKVILLCLGQAVVTSPGVGIIGEGAGNFNMVDAINANQIAVLGEQLAGLGYLLLTIVAFSVIFNLVRQMGPLTEKISDTAGFSPASEAVAPIAQSAITQGKRVTNWGKGVAGSAASQIGHDISRGFRLDKMYKWSGNKATSLRGYMTGTGSQGYKAFWRRKK